VSLAERCPAQLHCLQGRVASGERRDVYSADKQAAALSRHGEGWLAGGAIGRRAAGGPTCSSLGVGSSLLPAALPENTAAPWAAASLSHRRSSANSMRYRGSRSASGVACSSGSNLTLVTERLGSADSAKPRLVGSSDGIAPTRAPTRAFVGVTTCRQSAAGRDPRHGAAGRPRPSAALALRPQLRQGSRLAHCILRHQRADGIADRVTRVPARAGLGQTPRTLMKANQM